MADRSAQQPRNSRALDAGASIFLDGHEGEAYLHAGFSVEHLIRVSPLSPLSPVGRLMSWCPFKP